MNCLSRLSLKVSRRWGCSPCAFQTRWMAILETPKCLARVRVLQCVAARGFS